ncbi:hypothetical protein [Paraburkholderia sp. HP33-1]|uniref:hypothetical protein n=1 Tax=Paraburkholderia sp. HP33-1 TaxID=2883243 RepID=UPI001F37B2C8|nr:hypothetical protein [Paraburkholderia sp. HP33-1]
MSGSTSASSDGTKARKPCLVRVGAIFLNQLRTFRSAGSGQVAIVQVQYMGPGGIDFINAADDPRMK